MSARSGALFHGFAPSEGLVAVGVYVDDAAPSRWAYWAELQTPLERLVET